MRWTVALLVVGVRGLCLSQETGLDMVRNPWRDRGCARTGYRGNMMFVAATLAAEGRPARAVDVVLRQGEKCGSCSGAIESILRL